MGKIYRTFVTVLGVFLCATALFLHILPPLFLSVNQPCNSLTDRTFDDRLSGLKSEIPEKRELPTVWSTGSGDDRILSQIEYIPDGYDKESPAKAKVLWIKDGEFDIPDDDEIFRNCPVSRCTVLKGEDNLDQHIDAKMFNMQFSYTEIPHHRKYPRPLEQVWILYALESPMATPDYDLLDGTFNWTATYRRDSTIVTPYEKWRSRSKDNVIKKRNRRNYAKGKKHKVAIYVSNCDASSGRLEYIDALSQFIDVHVYGDCGTGQYSCDRYENETMCYENLRRNYKFYLAFENSNCKDYVTEKFYRNALMHDVVPVVMGAHPDEYRKMAPPNSFIHVEQFSSPKKLAQYLLKLDKNDHLYNEYFQWKNTGSFIDTKFWCRLCALMNDSNKPTLIVESLRLWWRPPRVCLRSDQRWLSNDSWQMIQNTDKTTELSRRHISNPRLMEIIKKINSEID